MQLTKAGHALRNSILVARGAVLMQALVRVNAAVLAPIVAQMLTTLTASRRAGDHMCRLCPEAACPDCPVAAGATITVSRASAMACMVAAAASWGLATVATKDVLTTVPPFTQLTLQLSASVAFL